MKTVDCLGYQHIHDGELCALAGHGEGICAVSIFHRHMRYLNVLITNIETINKLWCVCVCTTERFRWSTCME